MAKKKKKPATEDTSLSFEELLARIERSVAALEQGELGLDESMKCYEEGVKMLRQAHRQLDRAERKIELLAGVDPEGRPETEPFDDRATDASGGPE